MTKKRFYWSHLNVSTTTPQGLWLVAEIGCELSFEHAQKTGRDWFGCSEVLLASERSPSGLIFIADWFPTVRRSVSSRQGWELFATPVATCRQLNSYEAAIKRRSSVTWLVAKWFMSVHCSFAIGFAIRHWPFCRCHKNSERTHLLAITFLQSSISTSTAFSSSITCTSSQQKGQFLDLFSSGTATATVLLLTYWELEDKWFSTEIQQLYVHLFYQWLIGN